MRTVTWLIINSLNVGLVAVLVLFQPELRKLLTEIGEGRINKFFMVANQENRRLCGRARTGWTGRPAPTGRTGTTKYCVRAGRGVTALPEPTGWTCTAGQKPSRRRKPAKGYNR